MRTLLDKEELVLNPPELGCVLSLSRFPGGGSKIHDRSPYGNHGTITGATWVRLPSGLWCLSFDGSDDYSKAVDTVLPSGAAARTLSAWVKASAASQTNARVIVYGAESSPYGRAFGIFVNGSDEWSFIGYGADVSSGVAQDTGWHFHTVGYVGQVILNKQDKAGLLVNNSNIMGYKGKLVTDRIP